MATARELNTGGSSHNAAAPPSFGLPVRYRWFCTEHRESPVLWDKTSAPAEASCTTCGKSNRRTVQ